MADIMRRIAADSDGGSTHLANYTYLGLSSIVKIDYTQPDICLDLATRSGSDPYDLANGGGLDRLDRIADLLWRNYGRSADGAWIKHLYELMNRRLWRVTVVKSAALRGHVSWDAG
jgi:hypothetical protein